MHKNLRFVIRKFLSPIAPVLLPIARTYIRNSPFPIGKRFFRKLVFFLSKSYTARTLFGSKIKGRTDDLIQGYIYCFGVWEPSLTQFIKNRLEGLNDRTFIDVGANIGYYSLLAGECMPDGKVISVEAFPSIFERLVENININGYLNIRSINFAATETQQSISMYHAGSGNEGATTSRAGIYSSTPIVVQGRPMSDMLTISEITTTRLIKIDTEGAEYSVLKGIFPIFDQFPKDIEVIVEISPSVLSEEEILDIFTFFKGGGFFPYALPNPYDVDYYLFSREIYSPTKLESIPDRQTDVIFSRIDSQYLASTSTRS